MTTIAGSTALITGGASGIGRLLAARLAAVGYGASAPLDEAISKAAHRRNRRVEIRLDFPDQRTASN